MEQQAKVCWDDPSVKRAISRPEDSTGQPTPATPPVSKAEPERGGPKVTSAEPFTNPEPPAEVEFYDPPAERVMRKINVQVAGDLDEGAKVTRATPVFASPASNTLELEGGFRVSRAALVALEKGHKSLQADAREMVTALWDRAGSGAEESIGSAERWNGLMAAAWVATRSLPTVAKLVQPIEFRNENGSSILLHQLHVVEALRADVAARAAAPIPTLDHGFGHLNNAIRAGVIFELGEQSRLPVNVENGRGKQFSPRDLMAVFPPSAATVDPSANQSEVSSSGPVADPNDLDPASEQVAPGQSQRKETL